jgi:hypothetical protein
MTILNNELRLHWIFRIAIAAEFIGHGLFGLTTKDAWLPYFGLFGIDAVTAYQLMPIIGALDITLGLMVLLSPRRSILLYMAVWGLWTALLRPLSGEPFWEALERAGNYGVPLAFVIMSGPSYSMRDWFSQVRLRALPGQVIDRMSLILRLSTGLLLIGHGGFGAVLQKQMLSRHFASVGLDPLSISPELLIQFIGWFEICLGIGILIKPHRRVLLFAVGWKVLTELVYITTWAPNITQGAAGSPAWAVSLNGLAPVFEFVERCGSYAAPLALYFIESWRREMVSRRRYYLRPLSRINRPAWRGI